MIKKISSVLFSFQLSVTLLAIFAISIAVATFVENDFGTSAARSYIYNSWWFEAMLFVGIVNLVGIIFQHKLYSLKKFSIFLFHFSFLLILVGAAITRYFGYEGAMHIREGESSNMVFTNNEFTATTNENMETITLPFSLFLKDFILERYPGSSSPSWFESQVTLTDNSKGIQEDRRIFMNNVLHYRGYRFYQSSYDEDEKGTILSVNRDFFGTLVTYAGYFLLALGMILSLLNPNSRFRKVSAELKQLQAQQAKKVLMLFLVLCTAVSGYTQTIEQVPDSIKANERHASTFGKLLIQDEGGRIKPLNTFSSELLRKISRKTSLQGQSSDQVLLGMLAWPDVWQQVPMIRVSHPEVRKILNTDRKEVTFMEVFDTTTDKNYLLAPYLNVAMRKKPAARNQFDTELIRVNDRVHLCYQIYSGNFLRIFPLKSLPNNTWLNPLEGMREFSAEDSVLVSAIVPLYLRSVRSASVTKDWQQPEKLVEALQKFQLKNGAEVIPVASKIKMEIWYNKADIFNRLGSVYGLTGFLLLIVLFVHVFSPKFPVKPFVVSLFILIALAFAGHLAGLIMRWYISGHAPWSNAYESMVYISFATILAGLIFARKSAFALAATSLLAWVTLFVAHLNWMDPEITHLVPVLKSYWLLIHVAVITASYGFLALGALLAFINLVMMIAQTKNNFVHTNVVITELTLIIEMTLIVGLYLLTIGTFLGGVWANESWGRYWGWDPKETWALVTILVYAFIAHMRLVPGMKSLYLFNLMAVLGISTVIMTYFGVNYYLSGMHSYAKGDPLPVPVFVYYTVGVILIVAVLAYAQRKNFNPQIQAPTDPALD